MAGMTPVSQDPNDPNNMNYLQSQYASLAAPPSPSPPPDLSELTDLQKLALATQQNNLQNAQAQQQLALSQPVQTNLSPLMGLADQWTKSNLLKSYVPPQSPEEKNALAQKLQDRITQEQNGLTQEQQSYLATKLKNQLSQQEFTDKQNMQKYQDQQNSALKLLQFQDAKNKEDDRRQDKKDALQQSIDAKMALAQLVASLKGDRSPVPKAVPGYVIEGTDQQAYAIPGLGYTDVSGAPAKVVKASSKVNTDKDISDLNEQFSGMDMLNNIEDQYAQHASGLGSSIAAQIKGTPAHQYVEYATPLATEIGKKLTRNKVTQAEIPLFKSWIPQPSDNNLDAAAKMEAFRDKGIGEIQKSINDLKAKGKDTSKYDALLDQVKSQRDSRLRSPDIGSTSRPAQLAVPSNPLTSASSGPSDGLESMSDEDLLKMVGGQ